jgi:heat-inducible transcriptional repressor
MEELTERQKTILALVVQDYIETAQPVGSRHLLERFKLDISSATVRNEMAALTDAGYLRQPHASAGRIPSEDGYRYFVTHYVYQTDLPEPTRHTITHQFYQARQDVDQWMHLAVSILANQSQAASLITAPHSEKANFKHLELISTQGRQVLMVLVLVGGEILQQILTLAEPASQEQLSSAADRLNQVCSSLSTDEIGKLSVQLNNLEHDILALLLDDMNQGDKRTSGEMYLDGLTNVLSEPEFNESSEAHRTLRMFEERSLLQNLLSRTNMNGEVGNVQVLIGGEGEFQDLKQCSVVLARYGIPGIATGALGIFGPMRMSYSKNIPTVRFMADLLSGLVSETMLGDEAK